MAMAVMKSAVIFMVQMYAPFPNIVPIVYTFGESLSGLLVHRLSPNEDRAAYFCGMKLLIIEDDSRVASLLRRGLEEQGFHTDVAYDGDNGRKMALQYSYALIITDIMLPGTNGLQLCKELRNGLPGTPIIMLTALGTTDDKVEGFDAGADDYLVKPFEMRELVARIRVLLKRARQRTDASPTLRYANLEVNLHTRTAKRGDKDIHLTPKEFSLLRYLLENSNRVLPRTEIAQKVWNTHFDTGTNFIDVYINYLRNKVDRDYEPKLIHTRPGMGFILTDEA
jgi:DNA-binding response OmpR family regulator